MKPATWAILAALFVFVLPVALVVLAYVVPDNGGDEGAVMPAFALTASAIRATLTCA